MGKIAGALAVLAIATVLLLPSDYVFGSALADVGQQFLAWRAFAVAALRAGHLPLWNPYVFGGEPFLAGFQSAVFYPPNLIFLVFPLCRAINLSILLHLILGGYGMARWASKRGLHPIAGLSCGLLLALCGPVFPHVYGGHLSNLCAIAWAPWVFAGIEEGSLRGLLWVSAALCFQVLSGQVQYAYDTGLAAVIYALALWISEGRPRRFLIPLLAAAALFAGILAAVQLLPSLSSAAEVLRQAPVNSTFAGQFSFPPENLLSAVAPGFFGGPGDDYWGRCYPWEMSFFIGVSGVFLAALACFDPIRRRPARLGLLVAGILFLIGLGRHTPLFECLFSVLPGFNRFRGASKFVFPAVVFVAMAIADGADALARGRLPGRKFSGIGMLLGAAALFEGLLLRANPMSIGRLMMWVRDQGESYLAPSSFTDPAFVRSAGLDAGTSLEIAGVLGVLVAAALVCSFRLPRLRWIPLVLLPFELAAFSWSQGDHFRVAEAVSPEFQKFVAAHPGDYRIQNMIEPDNGFLVGAADIWGNDPGLLKRYAEFIAFTQGVDPDQADQNTKFHAASPLYAILRLRFILNRTDAGFLSYEASNPMQRAQLATDFRVLPGRNAIFNAMKDPAFDPRRTVLLESEPSVRPVAGESPGKVKVLGASADRMTIEADLSTPALLLVTDGYSRGWKARALSGSAQSTYEVLPADYVIRATPLLAGHHLIQFDYVQGCLGTGIVISGMGWAAWLGLFMVTGRRKTLEV